MSKSDLHMLHPKFFLYTFLKFLLFLVPFSQGIDTMTLGTHIFDDQEENLVSAGRRFQLGFFSPGTSVFQRYVGIWYYGDPVTVVWVANRESPLSDTGGYFGLNVNGDLDLSFKGGVSVWSTQLSFNRRTPNLNVTAKLMDSGNLVLSKTSKDGIVEILWQSFEHPTDTFLPGMAMEEDFKLTSWKGPDDTASGNFTFERGQDRDDQFIIQRMKTSLFWESGVSWKLVSDNIPPEISSLLRNSSLEIDQRRNLTLDMRLMISFDGKIQYFTQNSGAKDWNLTWFEPRDPCHKSNFCGNFGICNSENISRPMCRCLDGFEPQAPADWAHEDFSGGCQRTSGLCGNFMNTTTFQSLKLIRVGRTSFEIEATGPRQCENECLSSCTCQAYSYTYNRSAPTGKCWIWSQEIRNVQEDKKSGRDVYVRVAPSASNLGSSRKWKTHYTIYLIATLVLVSAVCALLYMWRKSVKKRAKRGAIQENLPFHSYDSERQIKEWINSGHSTEDNKERINVPFFDMEVILEATSYFSDENKLGQGGFGPVYKGNFPGGQEIAVKRLSNGLGQGVEQFKNEVLLIAQLQHRNLIRLLGYCSKGDEKLLVYEYMPNKSLDSFIFDRTRCVLLTWEIRMNIILGIARGMFYLHHDSRLRVIHRDLKASNVLLDEEMNPKISDFGLARIFKAKQIEGSTNRVMGTFGYMSPEYALDGFFSVKSDVFSFGVVVLEIISGKRNTGFYNSKAALNLLSYAWRLWNEDNAISLIDQTLHVTCNRDEALKCVKLALLCVQSDPTDRPTMSNITFTLSNENVTLPTPKQPAFVVERDISREASSSGRAESYFEISNSLEQGR